MALLTTGKSFIKQLEGCGALAVRMPLEGGFEGRYQRRLKTVGYETMNLTARGLGDVSAYLTAVHGVRPPHLGKKSTGSGAAVGERYFIPPMLTHRLETMPPQAKGMVLWLIEGHILAKQEIAYLVELAQQEPKVRVVVEMGGHPYFTWQPLADTL